MDSSAAEWEKKVHFKTKDGLNFSITFQATKVKKPSKPCPRSQKGNRVCFGSSEGAHRQRGDWQEDQPRAPTALTAWTWSTSTSQGLRGWTGGKEFDKTAQTCVCKSM